MDKWILITPLSKSPCFPHIAMSTSRPVFKKFHSPLNSLSVTYGCAGMGASAELWSAYQGLFFQRKLTLPPQQPSTVGVWAYRQACLLRNLILCGSCLTSTALWAHEGSSPALLRRHCFLDFWPLQSFYYPFYRGSTFYPSVLWKFGMWFGHPI